MDKKRILVCLGTRAEAVKLCPLYLELKKCDAFDTLLLCSGQHIEMADSVLEFFGVRADFRLELMKHSQTPEYIVDALTERLPPIFDLIRPDAVLVQGDTATAFGCALAAKEAGVAVGHIEAGMRSGNEASPYPEEIFRKRISTLARFHFAPSELEKENLLREGIEREHIYVTKNTVIDALLIALEREDGASPLVRSIDYTKPTLMLTCHRRENIGQRMARLFSDIKRLLRENEQLQIIYPIHKSEQIRRIYSEAGIDTERLILTEPLDYPSFVYAMSRCNFIISDSGGVLEEASYLGIPCIIARDTTERDMAFSAGGAMLCDGDLSSVYVTAKKLLCDSALYSSLREKRYEFGDGKASKRIVKILSETI